MSCALARATGSVLRLCSQSTEFTRNAPRVSRAIPRPESAPAAASRALQRPFRFDLLCSWLSSCGGQFMTEIGVLEAIHTARALRRFKPDPVPEAVITQILDAAIRAPSAGNAQNWSFVVVRDETQRRRLGEVYRKASDIASEMYAARGRPAHLNEEQFQRMMSAGSYLWDHMATAPVILV